MISHRIGTLIIVLTVMYISTYLDQIDCYKYINTRMIKMEIITGLFILEIVIIALTIMVQYASLTNATNVYTLLLSNQVFSFYTAILYTNIAFTVHSILSILNTYQSLDEHTVNEQLSKNFTWTLFVIILPALIQAALDITYL